MASSSFFFSFLISISIYSSLLKIETVVFYCNLQADILGWVSLGFGFGSWIWTQTQAQTRKKINLGLDSEFNSKHFGIEINKCLKFLRPKKFLGPKN